MAKTMARQVRRRPIRLIDNVMVTDLLTSRGRAAGVVGLQITTGRPLIIDAGAVVLATGGAHNVYPFHTGPEGLTGDGHAIAFRAGAELLNMEMVQSLPTVLLSPPMLKGSIFVFLLGPQSGVRGWLLNKYGERFMERWDPRRMERSTRDMLSVGIANEISEGRGSPLGGVYYSVAHLPRNLVNDFARWGAKPYIRGNWTAQGLDYKPLIESMMAGDAAEVAPAVHFFMGGIKINKECETGVPFLLAAGEVAGGLHGANRLSGNAFTQMQVQGKIAGERAARLARAESRPDLDNRQIQEAVAGIMQPLEREAGLTGYDAMDAIQDVAAKHAGVVRNGTSLEEGLSRLRQLRSDLFGQLCCKSREREYNLGWVQALQAKNCHTTLEAILTGALLRQESRGAHYRQDHREINREWLRTVVLRSPDGGLSLEPHTEPVRVTSVRMPE
jgi:succinate dehydrogenase/fumarate reductase flavoprotein subunit